MSNSDTKDPSQEPLSLGEVASALAPYGVSLSDAQLAAIARYVQILLAWNKSINLTAIEDQTEVFARHFGESFFANSVISMQFGRLADVGTGAGFPGIALKIAFPDLHVTLIEPNHKKCAFLTEVKLSLGLTGVEIVKERYEDVIGAAKSFDFVCSRALGNYRQFLRWARSATNTDGSVILWLGTEDSIVITRTNGWIWGVPVPIPESRRRVILVGRPNS
jgi:16S rRNA (guanine527-N7)-methyltransferase